MRVLTALICLLLTTTHAFVVVAAAAAAAAAFTHSPLLPVSSWHLPYRAHESVSFYSSGSVGASAVSPRHSRRPTTATLGALTERQMQFWEDVQDGLEDIAKAYPDASLERIYQFCSSAKGEIDPPEGVSPLHCPSEEHVYGLTARPFWDVDAVFAEDEEDGAAARKGGKLLFPWAQELERRSDVILDEFRQRLREAEDGGGGGGGGGEGEGGGQGVEMFAGDSAWQNNVMGEGWSAFRLQRLGEWNTKNCALFPETYRLLRSLNIPLAVRGVCFARQAPRSGVSPHSDGRNFILTSHLGLNVPDEGEVDDVNDADPNMESKIVDWPNIVGNSIESISSTNTKRRPWIKVGDEVRTWEVGKLVTLDTSFEHSTGNPTSGVRDVLIIDFWHPELSDAERACLEYVYDLRNKFERGDVPFRKPRSLVGMEGSGEGSRLAGLWNALIGGGGGSA